MTSYRLQHHGKDLHRYDPEKFTELCKRSNHRLQLLSNGVFVTNTHIHRKKKLVFCNGVKLGILQIIVSLSSKNRGLIQNESNSIFLDIFLIFLSALFVVIAAVINGILLVYYGFWFCAFQYACLSSLFACLSFFMFAYLFLIRMRGKGHGVIEVERRESGMH